jgi:lysozyme
MFYDLDKVKERIKTHEGFVNYVYKDTLGKRTVGYGHLCTDDENWEDGKCYDNSYLNDVFEIDFMEATKQAEELIGNLVLENKANEIILEMVFQLGKTGVSKFKKMWEALSGQDYNKAADEMLDSKWAKQTKNRAESLAKIMRSLA